MNGQNRKGAPGGSSGFGAPAGTQGPVVFEGAWLVERACASRLDITEILCVPAREAWARALIASRTSAGGDVPPVLRVFPEAELSGIAGYAFHRGAIAFARRPAASEPGVMLAGIVPAIAGRASILVLPETIDPENLGASFRNAAAFGCAALLLGPGCPDPFSRRVLRVSMGAPLGLPWARISGPADLALCGVYGFTTAACVLDPGALDLRTWDPPFRLALVLGNEAYGLSLEWLAACKTRVTLPMGSGADSLNVATAGAVFLYALSARDAQARNSVPPSTESVTSGDPESAGEASPGAEVPAFS